MDNVTLLHGVVLTPLKKIEHPAGDVYHGMKRSENSFVGFQEAYFSTVKYGIIKPWKKHLKMTLNIIVPVGCIRFVLYDDRVKSPSNGQYMEVTLSLDNYARLTVPPNIWMAFKGEGKSTNLLLNIADMEHMPSEIVRKELADIDFIW